MQDAREMSVLPSGERVSLGGSLEWAFGQSRREIYVGMKPHV